VDPPLIYFKKIENSVINNSKSLTHYKLLMTEKNLQKLFDDIIYMIPKLNISFHFYMLNDALHGTRNLGSEL